MLSRPSVVTESGSDGRDGHPPAAFFAGCGRGGGGFLLLEAQDDFDCALVLDDFGVSVANIRICVRFEGGGWDATRLLAKYLAYL